MPSQTERLPRQPRGRPANALVCGIPSSRWLLRHASNEPRWRVSGLSTEKRARESRWCGDDARWCARAGER
eukprot:824116-Prymnesium_polylepis.1